MTRKRTTLTFTPAKVSNALARVAVQLAREDIGSAYTAKELAGFACDLVNAAANARYALESGKSPARHYKAAAAIANKFHAQVVPRGDLEGMVVGLRLSNGRFTSGADNVFYVL